MKKQSGLLFRLLCMVILSAGIVTSTVAGTATIIYPASLASDIGILSTPGNGITTFGTGGDWETPLATGSGVAGVTATDVRGTGWDITVTSAVPANIMIIAADGFLGTGDVVYYVEDVTYDVVLLQSFRVASNDGSLFDLQSVDFSAQIAPIVASQLTVTGYRNSVAVSGATMNFTINNNTLQTADVSANAAFTGIDAFVITGSEGNINYLAIDNITVGNVIAPSPNNPPTDISLNNTTVNQSAGVNAVVGTLSTTDADVDDTQTYTLVNGADDTDNASFNISGIQLRANNAAALVAGNYSVRIRTTDSGGAFFEKTFTIIVIDNLPPQVSSIILDGAPVASATSVEFIVTFSEAAYNVSTDDFSLSGTGSASGDISSVSASTGSDIVVTVSDISGNGTLRLDLNANTDIIDTVGNGNGINGFVPAFTSGTVHTVAVPTVPGAPVIGSAVAGSEQATVTFTPPSSDGGAPITSYTVMSSSDGISASGSASPIVVTGLTNGVAYSFTVTATNTAGTSAASAASNVVTPQATQSITFNNPGTQNFGTSPTLAAASDSGLPVTFSSVTTGVCTITSGGVLTFVTAGTCTIDANQAGNTSFLPASTVSQSFTVAAVVPGVPTAVTATAGDTAALVAFTAPVFTGGANINSYTVMVSPPDVAPVNGSSSPLEVTGLTNGQAYTFTVTATNAAGTGPVSAASNSVTPVSVAVNHAPVATDDVFSLPFAVDGVYELDVLANDSDPDDDVLTITAANAGVGSVSVVNNKLRYVAPENFSGTARFSYRISDGELSDQADVVLTINGSNPLAPVISGVSDVRVNAGGVFTKVALGSVTAVDRAGNRLPLSLLSGPPIFKPGRHEALWQATDSEGVSSTVTQKVEVVPQVSLARSQQVLNHSTVTVEFILNGLAPDYPVLLPYSVSGSAQPAEHDLSDGIVEITSGLRGSVSINVFADLTIETEKTVVITLDDSLNQGTNRSTEVVITEANLAPEVSLAAYQQGEQRLLVSKDGGEVRVVSMISDANGDIVSLNWQADAGLVDQSVVSTEFAFEPSAIASGVYQVQLTATDDGAPALSSTATVLLLVRDSMPVLGNEDSNGNLIPDNEEGYGDINANGIPDYLDPGFDCNMMVEQLVSTDNFMAEAEPGVCISRGRVALESNGGGIQLLTGQLQLMEPDTAARPVGGVFDFVLTGLSVRGDSYQFVVPQREAIPIGAVYRKYTAADGWKDFVENTTNRLYSTAGEPGYCPPPGAPVWQPGLNIGHWCVQLLIEDGGPNDADGQVNGRIVDPGGVSVPLSSNQFPLAADDSYSVMWNQLHSLDVLANDSDPDEDPLTIMFASAIFGAVMISDNGLQLEYTPPTDFIGEDTLTYSITDGQGGTASAQVSVTVFENQAPQIIAALTASTNNRTAIELDVLSVVTDADGDDLTVTAVSAQHGSVSIVAGQRVRYVPPAGYEGTDVVSFTVSDGRGGTVSGTAQITITALEIIRVDNKSSGGAMGGLAALLLVLLAWGRRVKVPALLVVLSLLSLTARAAEGNWVVEGQLGQSKARLSAGEVSQTLPQGAQLLSYDNKDMSWSLGVSFRLGERLWLQGYYVDLGAATVSIAGAAADAAAFHRQTAQLGALLVEGVRMGLAYQIAEAGNLSLQVQGGAFSWWGERESWLEGKRLRFTSSDTDIYWGVQGVYRLTADIGLSAGYERYHLDRNKADNINLGIRWYF
ncbi:Ig-like domain-containing protein [Chromatiaceae bacterium AAb-1]|nr:Ig-like domain-containing protein [Chromatiaceae bacterium AAb-1]